MRCYIAFNFRAVWMHDCVQVNSLVDEILETFAVPGASSLNFRLTVVQVVSGVSLVESRAEALWKCSLNLL